jgi:hypothetical protein
MLEEEQKRPVRRRHDAEWLRTCMRSIRERRVLTYLVLALVVSVGFIFFKRDWLFSLSLTKGQADFWDAAFKGVGGLVAIAGVALTLSKYFDERAKANRAALIEAQKPFSTKRQEVYYQLVSSTSTIRNNDASDPMRREAQTQFWWLYWGVVPMVADDQVAEVVDSFSDALLDHPNDGVLLRNTSMNLARACRKSLGFVEH